MGSAGVFFARPLVGSRWTVRQGPLAQKTPTLPSPLPDPTRAHRRAVLCDPPPRFIQLRAMSSAGVFFARPLVGSRWTVRQGPLAQKTPTLLSPLLHTRTHRRAFLCDP
ncbi:MAG TPA: hypothetical protein VEN31_07900, partial [Candidatus Bathyarchaeia archaeon]|nr:hypothetical protein [Candidatus Bathyarchaeia archaeon]